MTFLDDQALAAFLAGTLPAPQRARVLDHLRTDAAAREVLVMARLALEAAQAPEVDVQPAPRPPRVRPPRIAA